MGTHSASMDTIFPALICETFREAFANWKTEGPLFVADEALLMGAETRSSSAGANKAQKEF